LLFGDRVNARLGIATALWCSCGPVEQPSLGVEREAIIGGATDTGDPEVFELRMVDANNPGTWSGCSSTLIAGRTLLTAAHCVDPSLMPAGVTAVVFYALNATSDANIPYSQWLPVTKTQYHPSWTAANSPYNDVGLALLAAAPAGVSSKGWNTSNIDSLVDAPIRAVGYGVTSHDVEVGSGTKREVALSISQIHGMAFEYGVLTQGIGHGDSGGPMFHTFPDGVERTIGTTSFQEATCPNDGGGCDGSMRTDYFKPFIVGWLQQNEQPTCAEDHLCASGCATPDVDCACVADGQCGGDCTDWWLDPDCVNCGQDGLCNKLACPTPDPDCVPMGASCTRAADCASRVCVGDATHGPFCSANCTTDTDCGGGLSCDSASSFC
jgi:hypothetical protein